MTTLKPFVLTTLRRLSLCGIALLTLTGLTAGSAFARGPGGHGGPPPEVRERMKEVRTQVLTERLKLDDATRSRAEAIFERFDAERRKLRRETRDAHISLSDLVEDDVDDARAYQKALDRLLDARQRKHALRRSELAELREVLTDKQAAQLVVALDEMRRHTRKVIRRYRRERLRERMDDIDAEEVEDRGRRGRRGGR